MVIKQQVYRQLMMPLGPAMTETNQAMDDSLKRGDFREGVRSFLEQRPPVFPRLGGGKPGEKGQNREQAEDVGAHGGNRRLNASTGCRRASALRRP